jgi:hypothetical protein
MMEGPRIGPRELLINCLNMGGKSQGTPPHSVWNSAHGFSNFGSLSWRRTEQVSVLNWMRKFCGPRPFLAKTCNLLNVYQSVFSVKMKYLSRKSMKITIIILSYDTIRNKGGFNNYWNPSKSVWHRSLEYPLFSWDVVGGASDIAIGRVCNRHSSGV